MILKLVSLTGVLFLCLASPGQARAADGDTLIVDVAHESVVLGELRHVRVFLPPDYRRHEKRYPVVYWFHGWGERYNAPGEAGSYDEGTAYGGDTIAAFVRTHDLIVVKPDGYNPRRPDEKYPRPYNVSPVETHRQFALYFPELVDFADRAFRTIPDRDHRGTSGWSMGGFMSFWVAGMYPQLVSSASSFMGSDEFFVGPKGMSVEYRHTDMRDNYAGVRTRLVTGTRDFIRFYHHRMDPIWRYTNPNYETEEFDADHSTPGIAKTLDFHMRAFADPLPKPEVWNHIDAYPAFLVWDWEVVSQRRQPGFTVIEEASRRGFRIAMREHLPDGPLMSGIKLWIATGRYYPPGSKQIVTVVRLRDGETTRSEVTADELGRIQLDLDGDAYQVGIGPEGQLALSGLRVEGDTWATAGQTVRASARFWNTGGARTEPARLTWDSPNPGVTFESSVAEVPALNPGAYSDVPVTFRVGDPERRIVKLVASGGGNPLPVEVPLYPAAAPAERFVVADGGAYPVFEHAVEKQRTDLGQGNGNEQASAGETIVILLPDGNAWRPAELISNDRCIDLSARISDNWSDYDHVGSSVKFSLGRIAADCQPGYKIKALAYIVKPDKPNHHEEFWSVEFPIGQPAR